MFACVASLQGNSPFLRSQPRGFSAKSRRSVAERSGGLSRTSSLHQHPHQVAFLHDYVLNAVEFDFGPRPLAEQHPVADLDVDRDELAALSRPPGPTAMTSPSWGFSFAVSGMMMPPLVFSSASIRLITPRS